MAIKSKNFGFVSLFWKLKRPAKRLNWSIIFVSCDHKKQAQKSCGRSTRYAGSVIKNPTTGTCFGVTKTSLNLFVSLLFYKMYLYGFKVLFLMFHFVFEKFFNFIRLQNDIEAVIFKNKSIVWQKFLVRVSLKISEARRLDNF